MLRFRPHALWRYRATFSREEIRQTERWLATARLFLATSALIAVWLDPGEITSVWAYALLAFYITHSAAILDLIWRGQESTSLFRILVHGADIVWPALISLCTTSQSNPFYLFFLFVIAAAAYRWGVWETVITSASAVALLWFEAVAVHWGLLRGTNDWFTNHQLPALSADPSDFEPKRLFMRSVYLLVMGVLLGYLAEQQKKLRVERDEAAKLLGMVRLDAGLAGTLVDIVGELLALYGATRALIASREIGSARTSVGILETNNGNTELRWLEPSASNFSTYLPDTVANCFYAESRNGREPNFKLYCLKDNGVLAVEPEQNWVRSLAVLHPFKQLMIATFSFGPELSGKIFLFEPKLRSNPQEELQFLQDLVRQVGPAIYNLYLLRRLRRRAGALERARLVRELHDGAVQSLIGVEMQVDVLRRKSVTQPLEEELGRIQELLREEVLKLRELMQQMKSSDMDARRLPGFLRDSVQRFQRETGIAAQFLMDEEDFSPSPTVCRELARIAQEALVNVRKHSGATKVLVQLLGSNGKWELIVEDDGTGFPFVGRVSQAELDSINRAPAMIRERVRLIQGELTIESKPGRGARLEIRIPKTQKVESN